MNIILTRQGKVFALALLAWALGVKGTQAEASERGGRRPEKPIQHLIVIYQENVSFDHYFGTYFCRSPGHAVGSISPAGDLRAKRLFVNPSTGLEVKGEE